jgi:hypothetical protein
MNASLGRMFAGATKNIVPVIHEVRRRGQTL